MRAAYPVRSERTACGPYLDFARHERRSFAIFVWTMPSPGLSAIEQRALTHSFHHRFDLSQDRNEHSVRADITEDG